MSIIWSASRIIISFAESCHTAIDEIAWKANCPFTILGHVGSDRLRIKTNGELAINTPVDELENLWRSSLARKLQAEAMAAALE